MKKKDPNWEDAKDFAVRMLGLYAVVILIAFVFIALGSCSTAKPKVVERVITEVRTETTFITDTLFVPLPAQSEKIITRDSISTLETDYATSTAKILSDGSLFHDLKNKERKLSVPFLKPVKSKDSIVYRDKEVPVPIPVPVEVPQPLTAWQRFQLRGFWALLIVLVLVKRKGFFSILMWFVRKFLPIGK